MDAVKSAASASGSEDIGDLNIMVRVADIITVVLTEAGFTELYLRNNGRFTVVERFCWFIDRFREGVGLTVWLVLKLAPDEHQ